MNIADFTSGQLEDRYQCKAFLPERFCHERVVAEPERSELPGRADRALGELNAFGQLIPDIELFIRMYVAREATQSSRIERMQTKIEDAFKDADDLDPEERTAWAEVRACIGAINFAIERLEELPLSNRLLRQTHEILMSGVRGEHKQPGQFRESQNWIGVSLKHAAFIPPHHDHVPDLMGDLEAFLHADDLHVHPLVDGCERAREFGVSPRFCQDRSFPYRTAPVVAVVRFHVACPGSVAVAPIRPFASAPRLGDLFREGSGALAGPVPSACAGPGMAGGA